MKLKISIPEAVNTLKVIKGQPEQIFEMIRTDIRETIGRYLSDLMNLELIRRLIINGGPEKSEYKELDDFIKKMDVLPENEKEALRKILSPVLTTNTLQGFAFQKPYGYTGDFEIIDKIYLKWESKDDNFMKWDKYFHSQAAAIAVRNRKSYFLELLRSIESKNGSQNEISVLNIGSGPGRDMLEYLKSNPESNIRFDCVELDKKAIEYASTICAAFLDKISFANKNIFRFNPKKKYDLIWSAGLFDYLPDKHFIYLLHRLSSFVVKEGKIIIGNFSTDNPTRQYMENFGKWFVIHRTKDELVNIAKQAGFGEESFQIESEPLGVNLFLHVKNT